MMIIIMIIVTPAGADSGAAAPAGPAVFIIMMLHDLYNY